MNTKTANITAPTEDQIKKWKGLYRDVYKITTDSGKVAYLRRPTRSDLSFAASAGAQDPLKFNESILDSCWLAGDEEIKTNDGLFMGVSAQINNLIEIENSTLEKL